MTVNNSLLYNAAICGYLAGHISERFLTKVLASDASYVALANEAVQWAKALDGEIGPDTVVSAPLGDLPAGTVAITAGSAQAIISATGGTSGSTTQGVYNQGELGKARLIEMLALAAFESRYYAQPSQDALTTAEFGTLALRLSDSYLQQETIDSPETGLTGNTVITTSANTIVAVGIWTGVVAGILLLNQEGLPPDQTLALTAVALYLAGAVDAIVPQDSTISDTNGAVLSPFVTLAPANTTTQGAEIGKNRLALSIAIATMEARSTFSLQQFGPASNLNQTAISNWAAAVAPPLAAAYLACEPGIVIEAAIPPAAGGVNNPLLYNEAYCGFIAGVLAGRPITATSSTDPFYEALSAAAAAFASKVDADIALDTQITNSNNSGDGGIATKNIVWPPQEGYTTSQQEQEIGKGGILWCICRGMMHGRPLLGNALDSESATYASMAAAIVAIYDEFTTPLVASTTAGVLVIP
jgi:hypothetical protein